MEHADTHNDSEHVIDVAGSSDASSSSVHERPSSSLERHLNEDQPSTNSRVPLYQPQLFSTGSISRNSPLIRRENVRGHQRSPLNSGLWISVELALTLSQIFAAVAVLSLSKHEKPRALLRAWVVGYASGCLANLPLLYWRFRYQNQVSDQDAPQNHLDSSVEGEDRRTTSTSSRSAQNSGIPNARLKAFVEYFKMALDCFFAVWFVVGNVWIFGGHSSSAEAP